MHYSFTILQIIGKMPNSNHFLHSVVRIKPGTAWERCDTDVINTQHHVQHVKGAQQYRPDPPPQQARKKLGWGSHQRWHQCPSTLRFSSVASWHSPAPEQQSLSYEKALLEEDRRGILIGWEERGKHSIRRFTGSPPLIKELMGITLGSNGTGRTIVTSPLNWQHLTVTSSSLNLIITCFFPLLDWM